MSNDSDQERKRTLVAQRKAYLLGLTDDANTLIQKIKTEFPAAWRQIVATVEVGGVVPDKELDVFVKTARQAFPERNLSEIGDLLNRCVNIVSTELGRPDPDRQ